MHPTAEVLLCVLYKIHYRTEAGERRAETRLTASRTSNRWHVYSKHPLRRGLNIDHCFTCAICIGSWYLRALSSCSWPRLQWWYNVLH